MTCEKQKEYFEYNGTWEPLLWIVININNIINECINYDKCIIYVKLYSKNYISVTNRIEIL